MGKQMSPIDYAKAACDTMMRKYKPEDLPPKGHFHYHQGVFLSGVYQTYCLCREERYFEYIRSWVDSVVDADGNIDFYDKGQLDDIQPGILLFPLWERTKEKRYSKALDTLASAIKEYPCNPEGGFWHKEWFPQQMWLDGLYMAGPICAEYAAKFGKPEFFDIAVTQALLMRAKTKDEATGLWYHAWDYTKTAEWADKKTGRAPEFWGRSIGWVPVALLDELDFLPEKHPEYSEICGMVTELLLAVCKYQSEEGRWYQVVNKGSEPGNWPENSCTCLYVAAICKAVEKGLLPSSYMEQARKGYEAVLQSLKWDGNDLLVGNVCIGTGVGSYEYYCERPVSVNDLHGMGAFLLMCAQMQKCDVSGV